jgi:hypothetical protein
VENMNIKDMIEEAKKILDEVRYAKMNIRKLRREKREIERRETMEVKKQIKSQQKKSVVKEVIREEIKNNIIENIEKVKENICIDT